MLFTSRLLGAPLLWNIIRGAAVPHSVRVRCYSTAAVTMHTADVTQAYAGIFAQSPGITRAWSLPLPGEGSETLLVQRMARNIEGMGGYFRGDRRGLLLLFICRDIQYQVNN